MPGFEDCEPVSCMSTDSREAALDLLQSVGNDDAYANIVWPGILQRRELTGRDAAFATDLAYGTLRMQGLYDAIIDACSSRPISEVDPLMLDIMRLGTHQLVSMRVPDHAAVDSTCALARARGIDDRGRVGFINAVLRKIAAHDLHHWQTTCAEQSSADAALAISTSHPEWIVREVRSALSAHLGRAVADNDVREALDANNVPARPTLALRGSTHDLQDVGDVGEGLQPGQWSPRARKVEASVAARSELVRDGRAIVQDEGSQLAVQCLLAAAVDPPESAWLDMCAGPGGKTALLADAAQEAGVGLLAVELHAHRAELVRSTVGVRVPIEIEVADATTRPWGNRFFDRVLVDAPCSGIGALRRRPEARWRRQPSDIQALTPVQHALLDIGLSSLRRGGVLAYVTCSPHVQETRAVVDDVLMSREDIVEEDARQLMTDVPDLGPGPHAQLWPHLHGTDAMFIALLRRT